MTNEELLEQLKQISELMANDEVIQSNENKNEINALTEQKEVLEKQISELELKLSDNSNYPSLKFLSNKAKLDRIKKSIDRLNLAKERSETTVSLDTTRLKEVDADIEACNELISEYENRVDEIGRELRSLGENPDKAAEKKLSLELTSKRESLDYLRTELSIYTEEKENLVSSINSAIESNKGIPSNIERYEELQKQVLENDKKDSKNPVDYSKKTKDENRLAELKSSLLSINNLIVYSQSTSQEELNILISEIESGSIDENSIVSRVKEIKEKLPVSLIESDYEKYDEQVNSITEQKEVLEKQISTLESKLSDVINYTPSIMAVEVMHDEISSMEMSIASYDDDIKFSEHSISKYLSDISKNNASIARYERKIEKIQEENDDIKFRMTDPDLSSQELDELNKQFNKNKKKIENARKQIDRVNKNNSTLETMISNAKKNKKEIENMKISDTKTLTGLKETLEDRKTVDRVSMLQDQETLTILTAQLSVLKLQEEILNYPYYEKLDNILTNYEPQEYEMGQVDEFEEYEVERYFDEIKPGSIVVDPLEVQEIMEEQEQAKPKRIVEWKEASNELVSKIKNSDFIKNLKKNLIKLGAVILLTTGVLSLKSCGEDVVLDQTIQTEVDDTDVYDDEMAEEDLLVSNDEVEPTPEVIPEPTPEVTPEPTPEVTPESTPEVTPEPTPEVTPEPTPEITPEPTPEVAPEPTPEVAPEPAPEVAPEPTTNITLEAGESLIVPETDGTMFVVDNSSLENSEIISSEFGEDIAYDYPESEEIGGVTYNEDNTVDVVINDAPTPLDNSAYSSTFTPEEQAFLDAFLQEQMEIMEQDTLDQGMSR